MSRSMQWYKAYPADFLDATLGWKADLKGAYRLLLDVIYMHDGKVADDAAYLSAHLGLSSKRKWTSIKEQLLSADKIQIVDGYITNYRAVIETESRRKLGGNSTITTTQSNKNNNLKNADKEIDKDIPPNPQRGDALAAGFNQFFDLIPNAKRGSKERALRNWKKLNEVDRAKAIDCASAYFAEPDTVKAAQYLRARKFDAVKVHVPPSDPLARFVYDTIADPVGFENYFNGAEFTETAVKPKGQTRANLAREKYEDVLSSVGIEIARAA